LCRPPSVVWQPTLTKNIVAVWLPRQAGA
jgi:hypothetical protein